MATTPHTIIELNQNVTGYDLTNSADFTTTGVGSGNGVTFAGHVNNLVFLKNDSGGAAVFTLKIPVPSNISDAGGSITSPTISVANGKTYYIRLGDVMKNVSTGLVTIECDVAGKVLVLDTNIT